MAARTGLARRNAERVGAQRWCMGADYEPLLRAQDVRSAGRKSRPAYHGRVVHFFSDLEQRAFSHFRWEPDVFVIEEQYYLEVEDTVRIAAEAGARHPLVIGKAVGEAEPFAMSTDLVVYFRHGAGERRLARQIKYSKDIELGLATTPKRRREIERTLVKLEIERRYWAERNVDWAVMTEHELSAVRTANIEGLLDFRLEAGRPHGFWHDALQRVRDSLAVGDGLRMVDLQRDLDGAGVVDAADFTACVKHLCAIRELEFDMEVKFDLLRPVSDFWFAGMPLRMAA